MHRLLMQLVERPEENPNMFFMQDIYTSPLLKADPSKLKHLNMFSQSTGSDSNSTRNRTQNSK